MRFCGFRFLPCALFLLLNRPTFSALQKVIDLGGDTAIAESEKKGEDTAFARKFDFLVTFTASSGFQTQPFTYADRGFTTGTMQPLYLQSRFQLEYMHRLRLGLSTLSMWTLNGPEGVFNSAWSGLINAGLPFFLSDYLLVGIEASIGAGLNGSFVAHTDKDELAGFIFMPVMPAIIVEHYWWPWLAFGLQVGYMYNYAGDKRMPGQFIVGLSTTFRMD